MLDIQNIHTYNEALARLGRRYYWPNDAEESRKSDQLVTFTFRTHAMLDSSANLENLLAVAQESGVALLFVKPKTVQFLGLAGSPTQAFAQAFSDQWQAAATKIIHRGANHGGDFTSWFETSDQGDVKSITHYQAPFLMQEHAGVYDCATGDRIKNRREVIQRAWDLGFACQRGRPLMVARQRWSGSRQDLVRAEEIFNEFYLRRDRSDPARKLCQVYTSASRHYAWPGTW